MTQCRVCGRDFDPRVFQVVVPGLGQGFDRVECAETALRRGLAPAAPATSALPAVVKPFPAAAVATAAPASASLDRRPFLVGANLALLAAGTAATVYLWLRVFGADPTSSLPMPADGAAPAWERTIVPAEIDTTPTVTERPEPDATPGSRRPREATTAERPVAAPTRPATPAPVLVADSTPSAPSFAGGEGGGGTGARGGGGGEDGGTGGGGNGGGGGSGGGGGGDGGGGAPPTPQLPDPAPAPTPSPPKPEPPTTEEPAKTRGEPRSNRGFGKGPPWWVPGPPPWALGPPSWAHRGSPPFGLAHGHHKAKHENEHGRAHEKGHGKKKGHGKHH